MKENNLHLKFGQTLYYPDKREFYKSNYYLIKKVIIAVLILLILIATVIVAAYCINNQLNSIKLSSSSSGKVSVKYIENAPDGITAAANFTSISETDLLNQQNTFIFKGTIINVKNIVINFNNMKEYRSIAQINIEKVYRGNCHAGDTVKIMLPCAIGDNIWVSDRNTVSKIKAGMTGIFMPLKYDDSSSYRANGATLALKDVADYGFPDGSRYAFLKGKDGLIFSKADYPSISSAETLDDIENYISNMIGQ